MSKFLKGIIGKKDKDKKDKDKKKEEEPTASACSGHKVSKDDFEVKTLLGKGAFGKVVLVTEKSTGKEYAMKVLFKQNVLDNGRVQDLFSERSVLRRSKHPYIVHLYYTFQSEHKLFFVMDYLQGGDLDTYLNQSEGKKFDEERTKFYGAQVWLALQYLHDNDIIYRDLKPENILLDLQGNAVLSDFGLSKDFQGEGGESVENRANSFVGSPFYVSPDVLRQKKYGNSIDWWSFGILLFRMITGNVPFKGSNIRAVFDSILHHKLDFTPYPWVSQPLVELITHCLAKDEAHRIKGPEIQKSAFFKNFDWDKLYNKAIPVPNYTPVKHKKPDGPGSGTEEISRSPQTDITPVQQNMFVGFSYANNTLAETNELK